MDDAVLVDRLIAATDSARAFARKAVEQLRARLVEVFQDDRMRDDWFDIVYRIKNPSAVRDKIAVRSSLPDHGVLINDFIGVRILTMHNGCVPHVEAVVMAWSVDAGLVLRERDDTVEKPRPGGYRALHLDFAFRDAAQYGLPEEMTVEVQIETWLQHAHAILSHRLFYKQGLAASGNLERALSKLSKDLHDFDHDLQRIEDELP